MDIQWNAHEVNRALIETEDTRSIVLAYFTQLVNEYHGVNRSVDYYDLIAGDWISKYLHTIYTAYRNVSTYEHSRKKCAVEVPVDTRTFVYASYKKNFYDYWEYAVQKVIGKSDIYDWSFSQNQYVYKNISNNWKRRIFANLVSAKRPKVILCRPMYRCTKQEWVLQMLQWRKWISWNDFEIPININMELNTAWRLKRVVSNNDDSFAKIACSLLSLHIPVALLEGFERLREEIHSQQIPRSELLYTANSLHHHLFFKILAAEWRLEGTRVLCHQHGGGYGVEKIHTIELYESRVADRFYSWGWTKKGTPSITPLSPPYIAFKKGDKKDILLVCGNYPNSVYRIHFQPMPGTLDTMWKNTSKFLINLQETSELLIRFSKTHGETEQKKCFEKIAEGQRFDIDMPPIFQRYSESKLIIHNYLGTSWLETLTLNIPTICFYDPDTYVFRDEAAIYISKMETVGIMHKSGEDAGKFLSGIQNGIQEWWNSADVQNARRDFVESYANFTSDWSKEWEKEFEGMLGNST